MLKDSGLLEVSDEVGFDRSEVQSYINNKAVLEETKQKALRWSAMGISGMYCKMGDIIIDYYLLLDWGLTSL